MTTAQWTVIQSHAWHTQYATLHTMQCSITYRTIFYQAREDYKFTILVLQCENTVPRKTERGSSLLASDKMMLGLFPPSSKVTFFRLLVPEACWIKWPTCRRHTEIWNYNLIQFKPAEEGELWPENYIDIYAFVQEDKRYLSPPWTQWRPPCPRHDVRQWQPQLMGPSQEWCSPRQGGIPPEAGTDKVMNSMYCILLSVTEAYFLHASKIE